MPRKLTLKEAEKRIRARNPAAWDRASPEERKEAVERFNAHVSKPDTDAFIRKQLAGTRTKRRG